MIGDSGEDYWIKSNKFQYPIIQISPEVMFANQIQFLDVDFISPVKDGNYIVKMDDASPLKELRNIIAGWYVTLRTIAVVGLLSVLIYVGIRIMISSAASDRAKYKQRLIDWIVAFCLLFFMHYIMAATITVVNRVTDLLADNAHITTGIPVHSEYGTRNIR